MAEANRLAALPRDTFIVRGPDRKTWLDGLLTCAVSKVATGAAGFGLLLSKQGKILTDAYLLETGQELLVGVAPGRGASVRELLDRYLVMEDAELASPERTVSWLIGGGVWDADAVIVARGELALGSWRTDLHAVAEWRVEVPGAADVLAEHGLGVYGIDFSERDNPHEASLDRIAVSWTKGCYLGQEVVCMQDMRGKVKRRLVPLDGSVDVLAAPPSAEVLLDGEVVGQVTSAPPHPAGARLLASISTAALEAERPLQVLGQPVRVAVGSVPNLR